MGQIKNIKLHIVTDIKQIHQVDMTKSLFVTVGTTKFDELIQTVTSERVLDVLVKKGFTKLTLQTGRGSYEVDRGYREDIKIDTYQYKPSIRSDIEDAALVISHAGAGSIQESLGLEKPLLVVINEHLMDCHQFQLARKLEEEGHLYHCPCDSLLNSLTNKDFTNLEKMPPAEKYVFGQYVDKLMGLCT